MRGQGRLNLDLAREPRFEAAALTIRDALIIVPSAAARSRVLQLWERMFSAREGIRSELNFDLFERSGGSGGPKAAACYRAVARFRHQAYASALSSPNFAHKLPKPPIRWRGRCKAARRHGGCTSLPPRQASVAAATVPL